MEHPVMFLMTQIGGKLVAGLLGKSADCIGISEQYTARAGMGFDSHVEWRTARHSAIAGFNESDLISRVPNTELRKNKWQSGGTTISRNDIFDRDHDVTSDHAGIAENTKVKEFHD